MVKFSKIDKQLKKELKKVQRNAAKKLQLKSRIGPISTKWETIWFRI